MAPESHPRDDAGSSQPKPNTSLGRKYFGLGVGKGGAEEELPSPHRYIKCPPGLALSLPLSHRQVTNMVRGSRWELI